MMRFWIHLALLAFTQFSAPAFAESEPDLDQAIDSMDSVKISEIKNYVSTLNPQETCLDEYLIRRKQMITVLSLSPVTIPAAVGSSALALGFLGNKLGTANNPPGGWGDLAGTVAGMVYGGLGMFVYAGVDTTRTAVKLHRLNLVLKTLGEQYLGRPGEKSDALYDFYLKKIDGTPLPRDQMMATLLESDRNGSLCDGSMLKSKRIRFGPGLKFKVATAKEFVKFLNRESSQRP